MKRRKFNKSIITVEDVNTPVPVTERKRPQKISTDIRNLKNIIDQLYLTGIYTRHPATAEYTLCLSTH